MNDQTDATFQRIMALRGHYSYDRIGSRVALMREYLRRAAWWTEALPSSVWPFFDIALAIHPEVRAPPELLRQVEAHLGEMGGLLSHQGRGCVRALHFAALLDSGLPLPQVPDSARQPFEPLLLFFERGSGLTTETGFIDIDTVGSRT